jgi:hypothetical protein
MTYTRDGGVIPSGIPRSNRGQSYRQKFGLFKGQVVDVVYPEDERNRNGYRVEYVVKVNGQKYPNAVDVRRHGGVYNYEETIRKKVEHSYTGQIEDSVYDEELDGEFVYVMFLNGNGDLPIIIGAAEHPRKAEYALTKAEEGTQKVEEFHGIECKIDKDGSYTVSHVGKKAPDGVVENENGIGTKVTLHTNGDYEVFIQDGQSLYFNKADKTIRYEVDGNEIFLNQDGILTKDKNDNFIELNADGITAESIKDILMTASATMKVIASSFEVEADAIKMEATGSASMKGNGGTTVGSSGSATNVDGSVVNLAGGGTPVARLGDPAVGIGAHGVKVSSTIVGGSGKVTSA